MQDICNLIEIIPNYEPKISEDFREKIDLNIRDLQMKFPKGCYCCGVLYTPKKYSSMISSHFNTQKHKKKCLDVYNNLYKEDMGNLNNLSDAFDEKCKANRELKKLNYYYKEELEEYKIKYKDVEELNKNLQRQINNINNLKKKNLIIKCENLIDL